MTARWTVAARRARLMLRHGVAPRAGGDPVDVTSALVGFHATDPVSVYLQAQARVAGITTTTLDHELYESRRLARVLGMRRTMFVVDTADVPMLRAAVTDRLAQGELRRSASWLEADGTTTDGVAWMQQAGDDVLAALAAHGPATAMQLRTHVPALEARIVVGRGSRNEGTIGMSTRVLFWLATVGTIIRARPGGTIASTAWTWARTEEWLGQSALDVVDTDVAVATLGRRYLRAFGPATLADLQWWTGWTKTLSRQVLAVIDAREVEVEDGLGGCTPAFVLPGDDDPTAALDAVDGATDWPDGPVSMLPALDATPMGWKERGWYLGTATAFPSPLFDRNGNVGPTVWSGGEVVGAWSQRPDGRVAWRLFDHARSATLDDRVARRAADVEAFLGDIRFMPRFPTPWQRELSG